MLNYTLSQHLKRHRKRNKDLIKTRCYELTRNNRLQIDEHIWMVSNSEYLPGIYLELPKVEDLIHLSNKTHNNLKQQAENLQHCSHTEGARTKNHLGTLDVMDALQFNCSWNWTGDRSFLKPQQNLITSKQILINSSISNLLYSNLGYKSFYCTAISPNMPNCAYN